MGEEAAHKDAHKSSPYDTRTQELPTGPVGERWEDEIECAPQSSLLGSCP